MKIETIVNLLNKHYTIEKIAKDNKLPAYRIIDLLLSNYPQDEKINTLIKQQYESYKIDSNKCLIISDTHIGRKDKNNNYLESLKKAQEQAFYNTYNYAEKNNIKHVIHAGDLFEGNCSPIIKGFSFEEQYKLFLELYQYMKNTKTFFLLGNHDSNLQYYDNILLENKLLELDENFKIIGVNYSYVYFRETLLRIIHKCTCTKQIKTLKLNSDFDIFGHCHHYDFIDICSTLYVPMFFDVRKELNTGFIEIENQEQEIIIKFIDNDKNNTLKQEDKLKKTKKLYK